jgi:RimJ/RimL family protein N-acetyltransferase/acyl carrier protein
MHMTQDEFELQLTARVGGDLTRVRSDATLDDAFGVDSLRRLELITVLADMGAEMTNEELASLRSVRDLYAAFSRSRTPSHAEMGTSHRPRTAVAGSDFDPAPAPLATRRFRLESISADTMPFLYRLATDPRIGFRWKFRGFVPDFDTFTSGFRAGVLVQFVVRSNEADEPIGHVVCYNYDTAQRFGYFAAVFAPPLVETGLPMEASELFVRYLFTTWKMRKIYLEVPSFNFTSFRAGEGRQFQIEGILKEHTYYARRYWDQYLLAIYPPADLVTAGSTARGETQ